MSGSRSRRKGADAERAFAKALPYDAYRGRQFKGGPDSPDVQTTDGIHWEVKAVEAFRLKKSLKQAESDSSIQRVPAVALKQNRQPWTILVRLDDLESLAARYLRACGWQVSRPTDLASLHSVKNAAKEMENENPAP